MQSFFWGMLRFALNLIYEALSTLKRFWDLQYRFDAQRRTTLGEISIAVSILGSVLQVLYPIWGGVPFIIALLLVLAAVISFWFMRAGISDPRLWDLTLIGIIIQVAGVAVGGIFMSHAGMSILQHLASNVFVRTVEVGFFSVLGSGIGYVLSALPGMFEGITRVDTTYPIPNFDDPDFDDMNYGKAWDQNKTYIE